MGEKKEVDKKYRGYRYIVLALSGGYRCGYVQIPKGHFLYEKDYSEQLPIRFKYIKKEKWGKRGMITMLLGANLRDEDNIFMYMLFNVHGSITFSGKLRGKRGYWIGFDCNHVGDAKDPSIMDEMHRKIEDRCGPLPIEGVIRTTEYVEKECKSLIDQIICWFDKKK